jgi:hypothetical protein
MFHFDVSDTFVSSIAVPPFALVCYLLPPDPNGSSDDEIAVELAWRTWSFGFYQEHVPGGLCPRLVVHYLLDYA